jgi:hypothetical protein
MPRLARSDAPGVLHHVAWRGMERRKIFVKGKLAGFWVSRPHVQRGRFHLGRRQRQKGICVELRTLCTNVPYLTPEIRLRDQMYSNQQTTEWKNRYRIRSGIEATNSELKRSHGIGKLRVRRAAKVCFAVACKVIACNIKRWAKSHLAPKGALQSLLLPVWARLKTFLADPNGISLCFRITHGLQF